MTTTDLKEYIKIVYEMEQSIFQQKALINKLEQKKKELPSRPYAPIKPEQPSGLRIIISLALMGFGLVWFFGCLFSPYNGSQGFFIDLLARIVAACIGLGICYIGGMLIDDGSDNNTPTYQQRYTNYQQELAAYNRSLPLYKQLETELPLSRKKLQQSEILLRSFYESHDVIYPKYRNLIAVSSFYDYLMSGRCSELQGHEGAYNIFEVEVRLNRIITQLDHVVARLNTIEQNQYMLYNAISASNATVDRLCSAVEHSNRLSTANTAQLNQINRNTALAAHEAELTRKEIEYNSRMNQLYKRL